MKCTVSVSGPAAFRDDSEQSLSSVDVLVSVVGGHERASTAWCSTSAWCTR